MKRQDLNKKKDDVESNVINIGLVSLFIQFGSTLIYSTGTALIAKRLFGDEFTFLLVRNIGESSGSFYKLLSGFFSDVIDNRKLFLYIGYGSIIFLKGVFWITTFDILPIAIMKIIFILAHGLDRLMNSIRDAPRDAIIFGNNKPTKRHFALRRLIGSIGSILGGVICIILLKWNLVNARTLYGIAVIPIVIANIILYRTVKDIPVNDIDLQRKLNTWHISYWRIALALLFVLIYCTLISGCGIVTEILYSIGATCLVFDSSVLNLKYVISYLGSMLLLVITIASSFRSTWVDICVFPVCFTICYLFLHSEQFKKLQAYNLSHYYKLLVITGLLSFAKLNDSLFFSIGDKVNLFGLASVVTMFTINYISQLIASFVFGKYASKFTNKRLIQISCLMMIITNILFFGVNSKASAILLSILLGVTNSVELVSVSVLSDYIPDQNIKGTLFGVFYFITGVMSIFGTLFGNKIQQLFKFTTHVNIQYTSLIFAIPSFLAMILSVFLL